METEKAIQQQQPAILRSNNFDKLTWLGARALKLCLCRKEDGRIVAACQADELNNQRSTKIRIKMVIKHREFNKDGKKDEFFFSFLMSFFLLVFMPLELEQSSSLGNLRQSAIKWTRICIHICRHKCYAYVSMCVFKCEVFWCNVSPLRNDLLNSMAMSNR